MRAPRMQMSVFGMLCLVVPGSLAGGPLLVNHPDAGVPGLTQFLKVSGDNVAGIYYDFGSDATGSFLYNRATQAFTPVVHPDGMTFVQAVSGARVAGFYFNENAGHTSGFIRDGAIFTNFDVTLPGVPVQDTYPHDVDSDGAVVGGYNTVSEARAFVRSAGGAYTDLLRPGSGYTNAFGIDGGRVVGAFATDVDSPTTGFLYNNGQWLDLAYPGASDTRAFDISGEQIVGDMVLDGSRRGFIYNITSGAWSPFAATADPLASTIVSGIDGDTITGWSVFEDDLSPGFIATIPEPGTLGAIGLIGLGLARGRRRS